MKIFYQISTHWDREWYKPFQEFRYYLTEMVDGLLEALENNEIETFSFDGQTIVIDDYLAIRPENEQRIRKLIKEGRIKIGPWYVMPDELLVSGESIVENFLVGHKTAEKYGTKAWKFGYINDIFGHIAQLPQILNGFGIDGAFLGRGAGVDRYFVWKSPDGSECFVFNYSYSKLKREMDECEDKAKYLKDYIDEHSLPIAIVNYTDDHAKIDKNTIEFKNILENLPHEVCEGLEKYAEAVSQYYDKLPKIEGELIKTAETTEDLRAVTHSISSYYPLKKENDMCERMLYSVLAPMLVMGEEYGINGKRAFFETARKYLLQNQPHDSICGCSIDQVHKNMFYRYSQVKEIADVVVDDFSAKLCGGDRGENGEYYLYVYNFEVLPREGVITVDVDFPREWQKIMPTNALGRPEYMFKITDETGEEVRYQILNAEMNSEKYNRQEVVPTFKHTIAMKTRLKPFGITRFTITPDDKLHREAEFNHIGVLKAENDYLKLSISSMGEISVEDKETGKVYTGLNTYVEDSDAGNGWFYESAGYGAQTVVSSGGAVEVLNKGSLLNRFRITSYMEVPAQGNKYELARGEEYTKVKVSTVVTLKDDKKVEFETEVDNTAKDHRLKVIFPTEIAGDEYVASQAFCFNTRKRGVTAEGINFREPESYEKNTAGIIGVEGDGNSIFFVGKEGFHEGGVYPDGTISVTMFRSMGNNFHEPNAVFAQLNQKMKFSYALAFDRKGVWNLQKTLCDKPVSALSEADRGIRESLISVDNERVSLSVIKPAESKDGYIIRLFNPTDETIKTSLNVNMNIKGIYETNLEEGHYTELTANENSAELVFEPYKIKTIYLDI